MLKLRPAQIEAFEAAARLDYERRLLAFLRDGEHDVDGLSDGELQALIRRGIARAQQYGLNINYDVTRFVEYTLSFGEDFGQSAETAWAAEILGSPELDGTQKMDRIDAEVANRLRSGA